MSSLKEQDAGTPNGSGAGFARRVVQGVRDRFHLSMLPFLAAETANQNRRLHRLEDRLHRVQEALGRLEMDHQHQPQEPSAPLRTCEVRVFSQWGEDGIIQHLIRHVPLSRPVFVEFGVEDYLESNTRFLLVHNNWSGLVLDCSEASIERIRASSIYWRHNLKAVHAFVTRENINELIRAQGLRGDIGMLSIDIDGMDYWVWESLEAVTPAIVIAEYNYRFGPDRAVTVPYDPSFDRRRAHHSLAYYGASLRALWRLAQRKGYELVGCESHGLNAFFVRRDLLPAAIPPRLPEEAYVAANFREAHDEGGARMDITPEAEAGLIAGLPLVDVEEVT